MSWSDHKDDKSRFDGWREFLNEGKEQQPEQVIKEEAQTISEEGDRPPRPSVYQRLVNNLLKVHPRGGADRYLGAVEGAEKWSPADLAAVGKAWELIDRLSNDISSAATVDDAWSAHRGAGVAQKEGAHTWDTAKKIAARLAADEIALPENPAPAAIKEEVQSLVTEAEGYDLKTVEPGDLVEITLTEEGPDVIVLGEEDIAAEWGEIPQSRSPYDKLKCLAKIVRLAPEPKAEDYDRY